METVIKSPVTIEWRQMRIPPETALLGVQADKDSEVVEFRMPRVYQGVDLFSMQWFADTYNEETGIFDSTAIVAGEDGADSGILVLKWTVSHISASANGELKVRLRAINDIENPDFVWQTETGVFQVADTFMADTLTAMPGMTWVNEMTQTIQLCASIASESAAKAQDTVARAVEEMMPAWIVQYLSALGQYDTLADLEAAVPNPHEGDQFYVGTSAPRKLYRWDGARWLDNGRMFGDSNAKWFAGTAVTGTDTGIFATVSGSKAGDMYLNSLTSDLYRATDVDTWDFVMRLGDAVSLWASEVQTSDGGNAQDVLDDHGATLGTHTAVLDGHAAILDGHTAILDEHTDALLAITNAEIDAVLQNG